MIQSVLTILYFALAIFLHIFGFSLIKKPLALPFISLLLYQRAVTQFASLRNKLLVQFSLCQVRAHKMFLNLPIIWICWLFWLCYCKWSVWSLFSCSFILFFFFFQFCFWIFGGDGVRRGDEKHGETANLYHRPYKISWSHKHPFDFLYSASFIHLTDHLRSRFACFWDWEL